MLAADVCVGAAEPVKLVLRVVHIAVEIVEELVTEQVVVHKIPLSPSMEVALTNACETL